jgi:hypothetical protein
MIRMGKNNRGGRNIWKKKIIEATGIYGKNKDDRGI